MKIRQPVRRLAAALGFSLSAIIFGVLPASAVPFSNGDYMTYTQDGWGDALSPASQLLALHIATLYPGGIEIGIPGPSGYSLIFSDQLAVSDFLPQLDAEGVLNADRSSRRSERT